MSAAQHGLLTTGTAEERALIALTVDHDAAAQGIYEEVLERPLDWHWIMMQAIKHRVLPVLWDTLISRELLDTAFSKARLSRLWSVYASQLDWINRSKNKIFLECCGELFGTFASEAIPAACLKGGALIGRLYHSGNRRLHDIDILIQRAETKEVEHLLARMGYQHGIVDLATQTLQQMSERQLRFWRFNNHVLPHFYLKTGVDYCPYFKLSVGYDFYDPADDYSVPSEDVIATRIPKGDATKIFIPNELYMLSNLCAHIYREGVSATYARNADNWTLIKFCDLRRFLRSVRIDTAVFVDHVSQYGLHKPFYYALHYLSRIYGSAGLEQWLELLHPETNGFLTEIVDGKKRAQMHVNFERQLFSTSALETEGVGTGWHAVFPSNKW